MQLEPEVVWAQAPRQYSPRGMRAPTNGLRLPPKKRPDSLWLSGDPYWTSYQSKMLVLCVSIDIGSDEAATIGSEAS